MADLNNIVKTVLPWIGTALGGPLGGIAASAVGRALGMEDATVATVKAVLGGMPPEELVKLKQVELDTSVKLQQLGYDSTAKLAALDASIVESVNTTMRAEAISEHWPTYSWRPFNGFLFGVTIFCSYFLLPLLKIPVPVIPTEVWITWGSILGIASYFRGKQQSDPNIPQAVQIPIK